MKELVTETLSFSYIGPEVGKGAKNVLYFSLSAHDSLMTHPFNTPALMLANHGIRVLSTTLPFHENGERPRFIQETWANGKDLLDTFFIKCEAAILEINRIVGPITSVAGLSRGALIASYVAAKLPSIYHILGFAPLLSLPGQDSIAVLADHLISKRIRFYIGHNDTIVKTDEVIKIVSTLIDAAQTQKISFPPIDLVIKPSVGFKGHGTLDPVFKEGVEWLLKEL